MSDALSTGRIVKVAGPVVDVEFPPDALPEINFAVEFDLTVDGVSSTVVGEVAQHLGGSQVRVVAMKPTDGLVRGSEVRNTGAPISVPVGPQTLGHIFNGLGQALDTEDGWVGATEFWPIHRPAPDFDELATQSDNPFLYFQF